MSKKISEETKQLIEKLYREDLPIIEIARRADVSYLTVYGYTRVRQRINPETGERFVSLTEYQEHLARQKGFTSRTEYEEHLVRQRINPETGKTFASRTEYEEHLVRQRINPETGKTFASIAEYREHLAKQKGFASITEYQEHLVRQRQQRPINQELSDLIKRRLSELGKNPVWLAEEIGVTRQAITSYIKRRNIPRKDLLTRLYSALEVPYRTLDDLLK